MSELGQAWAWYECQARRLKALDDLVRDSRNLENPLLKDLLDGFIGVGLKARLEKLRRERDELHRLALVRLFFGFEADFRNAFALRLKSARDACNGGIAGPAEEVLKALGAFRLILDLHRALDPKDLSAQAHGRVSSLRGTRNQLAHDGFHERLVDGPDEVYRDLKSALAVLIRAEIVPTKEA